MPRIVLDPPTNHRKAWNLRPIWRTARDWSGFAAYLASSYWRQARRPVVSLVFILPLVALYESSGWFTTGPMARNGAEAWLRRLLGMVGLTHWLVLPLLVVAAVAVWYRVWRRPWRLSLPILAAMTGECLIWTALLLLFAQAAIAKTPDVDTTPTVTATNSLYESDQVPAMVRLAGFAGAGVYEELLFRLLLIPPATLCFVCLGQGRAASRVLAIVLSSLVFAAAHEVGGASQFDAAAFGFRLLAGAVFAVLFLRRGFGIAAGTHAMYDVLASCW